MCSGQEDLGRRVLADAEVRKERIEKTRKRICKLIRWRNNLPAMLQAPVTYAGFSLWTATLHITYHAAMLRFYALLPEGTDTVYQAASRITDICQDLDRQGLLHSLWSFGTSTNSTLPRWSTLVRARIQMWRPPVFKINVVACPNTATLLSELRGEPGSRVLSAANREI